MTAVARHVHRHEHTHVHGGPPVLDIGGDVGAMLALVDDDRVGSELFVRSLSDGSEVHTGVWHRQLGDDTGTVTAAVFLQLSEGPYELVGECWSGRTPFVICGGELFELDLRSSGSGRD